MSEENVELQRQGYDAWNRGDRESWLALADPDVELTLPVVQMEGGGPLRGHQGAARLWDAGRAAFPDLRFHVEEIRNLRGGTTFARVRFRGHGARSNVPLDQRAWHLMEWRNGKLLRFQAFLNEAEALEAAGLSE